MNRKRFFFCLGAVVVFAWILTLFSSEAPEGSTYSTRPRGAAAIFEVLERFSYPVDRYRHAFSKLSFEDTGTTLIVISPEQSPAAGGIKAWIEKGNTLVYFAKRGVREDSILAALGVEIVSSDEISPEQIVRRTFVSTGKFRCPTELAESCEGISTLSDTSLLPFKSKSSLIPVRVSDGIVTGGLIRIGKGRAYVFTDAAPILNETIDAYDNFEFLYAILIDSELILFDEFHHGFVAPAEGVTSVRIGLLFAFSAYVVVLLVLAVLSRAVRFGPPAAVTETPETASTEFVRALGLLYGEREIREVLESYVEAWRRRAAGLVGGAVGRTPEQVVEILSQKGILSSRAATDAQIALITLTSDRPVEIDDVAQSIRVLENSLVERSSIIAG